MKDIKEYLLKKIGKEESFKLSKMTVKGIILEVEDNGILLEITECNNDDIGYKVGKTYFISNENKMLLYFDLNEHS